MILRYIQRRLAHLREQPEPARLRAATLLTAGTGGALVLLWLVVLLPLQIKLNAPDGGGEATTAVLPASVVPPSDGTALAIPSAANPPDVAGTRTATPLPLVSGSSLPV